MLMLQRFVACVALLLGLGSAIVASQQAAATASAVYAIDPKVSEVRIHVDKSGVFGFAGHTHEVRAPVAEGRVEVVAADLARSTVRVAFDASALRVSGEGEPKDDVPEVQKSMLTSFRGLRSARKRSRCSTDRAIASSSASLVI